MKKLIVAACFAGVGLAGISPSQALPLVPNPGWSDHLGCWRMRDWPPSRSLRRVPS